MKLWEKFASLFRRKQLETDMAEEMRLHLERRTEENAANGLSPAEARYEALRRFGGVDQVKEIAREQRGWVWLEQFSQDVLFAARGLRKDWGFTVVAVLTLGFGIGVNTSMFTALQSILMRELPFADADHLVQVFRTSPHSQRWPHAPANFLEQQARNTVFERMAAFNGRQFNFAEPGQPAERVGGLQVSAEMFPLLGVQPALGRVFTVEEDRPGNNRVAVLDHGFWMRRLAGDPDILGRTLRLDGESVTVVGVMPPGFRDRPMFGASNIWTPLAFSDAERENRGGNYLKSVARLKPGVSMAQAQAAIKVLGAQQALDHPEANAGIGLRLVPMVDTMDPRGRTIFILTMVLAGFVLLIACANLANLQFARTARRTRELAIRGALGAPPGRILRQLLTESLLIAALGGAMSLVVAHWGTELLSRQVDKSGELAMGLNWRVLGFALGVATLSGFAFGWIPAWLASRTNASEAMKQGSRGATGDRARHHIQHALIVAEVALALVLLAGAGLMVRGLQRFTHRDPGWEISGVTVGNVNLPKGTYADAKAQRAFVDRLHEKFSALPGAEHAAIAWSVPIRSRSSVWPHFSWASRCSPAGCRRAGRRRSTRPSRSRANNGIRRRGPSEFSPCNPSKILFPPAPTISLWFRAACSPPRSSLSPPAPEASASKRAAGDIRSSRKWKAGMSSRASRPMWRSRARSEM
ncbi:MAG: ABC transporter permease [Opitutaceae bacterium]